MVMDTRQKFDLFASMAVVKRVISNEYLGRLNGRQRQDLFVENCEAEQMQELAPVGIDRIKEAVNGVLADFSAGGIRLEVAEEVLAGKDQAEDHAHNHNGSNAALFGYIALP